MSDLRRVLADRLRQRAREELLSMAYEDLEGLALAMAAADPDERVVMEEARELAARLPLGDRPGERFGNPW